MSDKIKIGIVGMGRAGDGMHCTELKRFADKFEVSAVCDKDAERAEAMGKKYSCPFYTSIEDLLAAKKVELVAVATYSLDHLKNVEQALDAGYSVIAEKPLALNYAAGKRYLELDAKYPGKLFCRQNRRFEAAFQHVTEILASGILGKIHTIKLCRNSFNRRNDWQVLKKNGGGQLNNWGPHLIDHALQFLNYEVASVWGELKQTAAMGDADDAVKILLRNGKGLTVDIEISGGVALPSNTYEIYGSRGALSVDPQEQDIKMRYVDPEYELKPFPVIEGHPDGFKFSDNAKIPWIRKTIMVKPASGLDVGSFYGKVYDAMRNGETFPITAKQAVEVIRITEEIRKQNPQF